jgi:microcin C transport system permease protein
MADHGSENHQIPRDDAPRVQIDELAEQRGPLDAPQELAHDDVPRLEDRMLARQSIALRHLVTDVAELEGQAAPALLAEATGAATSMQPAKPAPSVSIFRKRLRKFKSMKRGYYSFVLLSILYLVSFLLPILVNNKAVAIGYNGETYFPALLDLVPGASSFYPGSEFGQPGNSGEANYRELDIQFEKENGDNWVLMPLYPWSPIENDFGMDATQLPAPPSSRHLFGTDDVGRDVFSRMCYGFNISISFALILVALEYMIGAIIGGVMGYYGGKVDLIAQRFVEIWANIPFIYTVIIIGSIVIPSFSMLIWILAAFQWISISAYMRGEFYREKAKDYVAAAIALGARDRRIIFKHILPNSLTPLIAFLPFAVIGGITVLVSLDFLGFGLPVPTPSWGQMLDVGRQNLDRWWLIITPLSALFLTLLLVTFIGEAIREAFDPRVYSRLR